MKLRTRILGLGIGSGLLLLSFCLARLLQPALSPANVRSTTPDAVFPTSFIFEFLQEKESSHPSHVKHVAHVRKEWPHDVETTLHLTRNQSKEAIVEQLLSIYDFDWEVQLSQSPWKIAADWVTPSHMHPDFTPEMGGVLREMATRKIISADIGHGGTQLKLKLTLEGGQKVIFKPKWYSRNYTTSGSPYAGNDRHNGEIASFHLNRILGFNRSPLMVGRVVDLLDEIGPVAETRLLKTFYVQGKTSNGDIWNIEQ